jgi:hypothetical protein
MLLGARLCESLFFYHPLNLSQLRALLFQSKKHFWLCNVQIDLASIRHGRELAAAAVVDVEIGAMR